VVMTTYLNIMRLRRSTNDMYSYTQVSNSYPN